MITPVPTLESLSPEVLDGLFGPEAKEESTMNGHRAGIAGSVAGDSRSWLSEFIARHGIKVNRGPFSSNGNVKWQIVCPFNPTHTGTDCIVFTMPSGAMGFKCSHNSCSDKGWQQFRAHFEPHRYKASENQTGAAGNSGPTASESDELELVCCADIRAIPIQWLWPGRIALKKITTLAGMPGLGKTQLLMWLAALVSNGGNFPVTGESAPAGSVVVLSGEDGAEDTLLPRLLAAGANRDKVHCLKSVLSGHYGDGSRARRMLSLERDIATIGKSLAELGDARLVIIDPISAYMGRRVDSHNNTDVRGILAPLAELAEAHNVAIVLNTHLSKARDQDAMMRVTGSIAFVAAARAAWLVVKDKDDPARRMFLPLKNNLAPDHGNGLSYTIEQVELDDGKGQVTTSRIVWGSEYVETTADEAMRPPDKRGAKADAEEWLRQQLSSGSVSSSDIFERGAAAGHSQKTLYRAKASLGIRAQKTGYGEYGGWSWRLPEDPDQDFHRGYEAPPWDADHLGHLDHLNAEVIETKEPLKDGQPTTLDDHIRQAGHLSDLIEEEI